MLLLACLMARSISDVQRVIDRHQCGHGRSSGHAGHVRGPLLQARADAPWRESTTRKTVKPS